MDRFDGSVRMRRVAAFALVASAIFSLDAPALAKGQKPAPARAVKLPAGCERLADGRNYALSHDGARLAFARWVPDPKDVDYHAEPIPKSTVWVRTIAAKKDAKVSGAVGVPVAWTTAGGLCLTSGVVVDPASGKPVAGTAVMPKGAKAEAIAWTRDGTRLVYAADWTADMTPPVGVPQVVTEVDAKGTSRPLDFGDKVYPGEGGTFSWTKDGKRVAFNIPFFEMGQVPPRRTGYYELSAEPAIVQVAEIAQDNGIPGMQDARRPMRPHLGTTGPVLGPCVWDDAGAHLVYVGGEAKGEADVWIYDTATQESARKTTDRATKWSPAIDAAGRRVAFLMGKVEDWSVLSPRQMTLNPKNLRIADAKLRVLDVVTGEAKDFVVPGEPAYPGNVTWSPDGARVLYEIHGGDAEGIYAQTVPAPAAVPGGK
jgi:Tol biopolymer transport system component